MTPSDRGRSQRTRIPQGAWQVSELFHVVISGSRSLCKPKHRKAIRSILSTVDRISPITTIYHGGATGPDTIAEEWAREHCVTWCMVEPRWDLHGRKAGPIRNRYMVDTAMRGGYKTMLIAIWDGKSRGTKSTIDYAKKKLPEDMVRVCLMEPQ